MNRGQGLKHQLPYPYDQDLSGVLRRLNRRTPASRGRLANDPVTAAYLAAGMRLIETHLGPQAVRTPVDPEDENSIERPLLSFLSQRSVAAEVGNNPTPFPQRGSVSTLRSTWSHHSDYIADLLRFGLWAYHPNHCDATEAADILGQILDGPHFVEAIHRMGFWNVLTLVDRPRFRLELIATAAAEGDEVIQKAMAETYQEILEPWKEICAELLSARGGRLRPGITIETFVDLITAVMEGVALHALAAPDTGIIDRAKGRTLAGTALLALIRGCIERADQADGLTLEQAVEAMVYTHPTQTPPLQRTWEDLTTTWRYVAPAPS
ncbi:TetR family transcriptional regulator C-terminal domain-containing protein [Actinomadura terrae]|uniref:TetR family transcriptional regulator C-terminal domain-containing protein n=1 Tax=Actinomadura terrae TaxID=604353 RepID=UPI001FA6AA12|nr:TetR family transcriptional regulator C-terminal domain-containing protein [Actinomadura terrae]